MNVFIWFIETDYNMNRHSTSTRLDSIEIIYQRIVDKEAQSQFMPMTKYVSLLI